MHVELVSKNVYWYGSKGVDLFAYLDVHEDEEDLEKADSALVGQDGAGIQRLEVRLLGMGLEPEITVMRGSWAKLQSIEDGELIERMKRWVGSGNPLGWDEEIARYHAALSRVDLPCPPEDVKTEDRLLIYKVTIVGQEDFKVAVPVEVRERETRLSISLLKGHHENFIGIGDCVFSGAVNLDTVRAAVIPVMTRFLQGVQHLMERVAQPVDTTHL